MMYNNLGLKKTTKQITTMNRSFQISSELMK